MGKQSQADVTISVPCRSLTTWDFVLPTGRQNLPAVQSLSLPAVLRHRVNRRLRGTKRHTLAEHLFRSVLPAGSSLVSTHFTDVKEGAGRAHREGSQEMTLNAELAVDQDRVRFPGRAALQGGGGKGWACGGR